MHSFVHVKIRLVNFDPEKVSHNPATAWVRAVQGDWVSLDYGSRQLFQISTGLRRDGKYQIVSGLDQLIDGYRDPAIGSTDDDILTQLNGAG